MLGVRIMLMRKAAGMSQSELARRLKISPSAVGMYEQGRRQPSVETLADLSNVLQVSIDYLVTGRPASQAEEQMLNSVMAQRVTHTDSRLQSRINRPFSREELAVIVAALLMEP